MRIRKFSMAVILPLFVIFASCSNGGDGPAGPAGPSGKPGTPVPINVLFAGSVSSDAQGIAVAVEAFKEGYFPLGSQIDVINLYHETPTLSYLNEFDAVLLYTDIQVPQAVGDVMADYVDAGGKVVVAAYSFSTSWGVQGRIMDQEYCPLQMSGAAAVSAPRTLDFSSIEYPLHPIFNGVDIENCVFFANYNTVNPPLSPGATLLALDSEGANAIAINTGGNIIALNFFPYWTFTNDTYKKGEKLIANALLFVAGAM